MVSCREFLQLMLDGWLRGELPQRRQRAGTAHVQECSACANYIDTYVTTQRLLRQHRASEQPVEVPENLVAAILDGLP